MTQYYPGSGLNGYPPATGIANRVAQPTAPVTAQANYTAITNTAPEVAVSNKVDSPINTQEIGQAVYIDNPLPPALGLPNHIPFPTPLGLRPHFETPTQDWPWDYGNGGGGGYDGGA